MTFSAKQIAQLRRDVRNQVVRTRMNGGREISYLEGWYVLSEANRIFGFDGWHRETLELKNFVARESKGVFLASYLAKVRVTVFAEGSSIVRDAHGTGEGKGNSAAEAHDIALKTAETDATKRALATFGKPFGLALYRRRQSLVASTPAYSTVEMATEAPSVPAAADQTGLLIGKPKRLRDRDHLRHVGRQPCVVCGRQPADAHHVRYAQPQALGSKVSDEFVVPLCRSHHRDVHQTGNERAWWSHRSLDPLAIARRLWVETRKQASSEKPAVDLAV